MSKLSKILSPEELGRRIELEKTIDLGMASFVEVGNALLEISDSRLYRSTHSTFKEYVEDKYKMSVSRAYRLAEAAEVVKSLPENVAHGQQINERQARELSKVDPNKRADVLEQAKSKADEESRPMTARDIKHAASGDEERPHVHSADELANSSEAPDSSQLATTPPVNSSATSADEQQDREEQIRPIIERSFHRWFRQWPVEDLPTVRRIVRPMVARD